MERLALQTDDEHCTYCHQAHCLQNRGKKDTWSQISIKKPQLVNDYNADMLGVDKSDQLIRLYNILMKCVHRLNTLLLLHGHLSC